MITPELLAIGAVLLCAVAILPGTLGILMFTNKIAASDRGARYIYRHSVLVFLVSVALLGSALYLNIPNADLSVLMRLAIVAYGGILVFGFFMHTKLMFKPIRQPIFITMEQAMEKFGADEEVVGVVDDNGKPWAFVSRLARRPHIVYQAEGDAPFLMTHCILAHSSMSYALEGKFKNPDITITAALANNMVFYEKTNECSVIQLHNQSRNRELPLRTVPTLAVSLGTWRALYPDSTVWIRSMEWRDIFYLKLLARADVIDPKSPVMVYPLQNPRDDRLPMKSMVIGVTVNGENKTYPTALFKQESLIHDRVGGTDILLLGVNGDDYIQVFDRVVEGAALTFEGSETADQYTDIETGSLWSATGQCVSGERKGQSLKPIAHYNKIFWYVWSDFNPGSDIHVSKAARVAGAAA